ncbi:hypothetical protein N7492_007369 [Penicillium capsulatum]|uniref:Xylanolytic transcriptional activator regulatory domain-containing protein n=1 Tax=Penicillium capsulatum TaxID=69766 RepID=A0A9W9HZR5_9EURO|nr:hypothetical protein N7492_007369 [Penicillium capsulatum]KAJ6117209.1 hypothetical protein N7512_006934 [Penicillium capsulatum]
MKCQFSEGNIKILVSGKERHTNGDVQLPSSVNTIPDERNDQNEMEIVPGGDTEPEDVPFAEPSFNIWTSPFTLPSTIMGTHHEQRKWIWLAPASPWSLTARLIAMMTDKLEPNAHNGSPRFYRDGDIHPFSWNYTIDSGPLDTSGLPSLDYALHLFQNLSSFSWSWPGERIPIQTAQQEGSTRLEVSCTRYVCDAKLRLDRKAQSIGYRSASAGWVILTHKVGHAIRTAQMEGMHTQLPDEALGTSTVAPCRNLWWSLYTMDRHISPSLGLPMTTKDSDITTLINPSTSGPRDLTFNLQVRITRMFSFIISTIYKSEKTRVGAFLEITRSILETMARYAEEIEKIINVNFEQPP